MKLRLPSPATLGPLVALVLACAFFGMRSDRFLTGDNLSIVLQQVMVVGVIAVGQTLIILTAGVDLSCGMVMALGGIVMTTLAVEHGVPVPMAIGCGIGATTAFGLINGLLVTRLKLPPFIVTLGTLNIAFAITQLYSDAQTVTDVPDSMTALGGTFQVGNTAVVYGAVVMLLLYVVATYVLTQTAAGRHVYAVGNNPEAARLTGIATPRVLLGVYVVAGVFYGHRGAAVGGANRRRRSERGTDREPRRDHCGGARRDQPVRRAWRHVRDAGRRADRRRVPQRTHADGRVERLSGPRHRGARDSRGGNRSTRAQGGGR